MLEISDSGENINLSKQATKKIAPVAISNDMAARLPDGSTTELSHIATIQIPGPRKQDIKVHIPPKPRTAPLISLGVLCYYGCTITLYKQEN